MATIVTPNNKAGIERLPVDRYMISSNEVTVFLQNQLGFTVGVDYTRWTGVTANHSYVRMRVALAPKDILAPKDAATNYAERVLQQNAAGLQFKKEVMEVLERYMYSKNLETNIRNDQEKLREMYTYGVYGERLNEILTKGKLSYAPDCGLFRLYLMPDAIVRDMLSDPSTNEVNGALSITGVFGSTSDTIRWEVEVSKGGALTSSEMGSIPLDKIFQ